MLARVSSGANERLMRGRDFRLDDVLGVTMDSGKTRVPKLLGQVYLRRGQEECEVEESTEGEGLTISCCLHDLNCSQTGKVRNKEETDLAEITNCFFFHRIYSKEKRDFMD